MNSRDIAGKAEKEEENHLEKNFWPWCDKLLSRKRHGKVVSFCEQEFSGVLYFGVIVPDATAASVSTRV